MFSSANEKRRNMEGRKQPFPQLSNEMQLNLMNSVKSGKMSIDEALEQAKSVKLQKQSRFYPIPIHYEDTEPSQYNFSVRKFNRYLWQKRVLQLDFSTRLLCNIQKGIVKRQLVFSDVTNCHDTSGTRFSISFRGRHDFELEATSIDDKQKILQLVNQIIYINIYGSPENGSVDTRTPQLPLNNLKEGHLFLQRGGLASFKWKKHEAHLHSGQLTLYPVPHETSGSNGSVASRGLQVPKSNHMTLEAIREERDSWVKAIRELCVDWKRRSQLETHESDSQFSRSESKSGNQHDPPPVTPLLPRTFTASSGTSPEAPGLSERIQTAVKSLCHPSADLVTSPVLTPTSSPLRSPDSIPEPSFLTGTVPAAPLPPPLPAKSKKLSKRTKAFHWDLLPKDKIDGSMWSGSSTRNIEIDTTRLFELFELKETVFSGSVESTNATEIMLDSKIAHNFNIFLKSFLVHPKELKDKLLILNEQEGGLSDEHIASLRRYVPTPDDVEMYKSHKGDVELHVVDQYMMEMCKIPNLSAHLDLLLSIRELPISMADLTPLILQQMLMCQQLWDCQGFISVLEHLLAMGNYLNQNSGKDRAKGFRLSSLTKLSQLRGNNRKVTLLHALVEQLMLREPRLATFFLELAEFETFPGASVKGLTAEVDVVKNEFKKVVQYTKADKQKNMSSQQMKFFRDLETAIKNHEEDLQELMKRCEVMRRLYKDILVKFGEPLDQDSQELFGWICQFINEFKKVYSEYSQ
ncbi:hypothetical protein DNTS_002185 [Danionella cerebrum]|uniref:FH2 domain-containing protein n=1 Tax=Danionella cerebrum TaxID=2873325 RepID=A0A553QX86_9TELE|nr:hypothetical protein DNTS_002185 [Danionella translucida]